MELVPILSTIILVGTIATFILAVAAYILYKIRERRSGREVAAEERRREEPHALVEPAGRSAIGPRREAPADAEYGRGAGRDSGRIAGRDVGRDSGRIAGRDIGRIAGRDIGRIAGRDAERNESLFWEYTDEGFVPVRPADAAASGTASGGASAQSAPDHSEPRRLDSDRAAWT